MDLKPNDIIEDHRAYYSVEFSERVLEELFFNSYRTIQSVYIFKHFDEYVSQMISDKYQFKDEVYWNSSYYEKLTDYIKISIAFENYNKAVLIRMGYLVHLIKKNEQTKALFNLQQKGPIKISDFLRVSQFKQKGQLGKFYLEGLKDDLQTIQYSVTLNEPFQEIIGIDRKLVSYLQQINAYRNRLHFFTDFKGAYRVDQYIEMWRFIKESSLEIINKTNFGGGDIEVKG